MNMLRRSLISFAKASFSKSGGPGGQNVNKGNTKVILKLKIDDIAGLSETELERAKLLLANRISNDREIVIISDEERSAKVNLERAYSRMETLITGAAKLPRKRRRTKPSKAAKEKRLQVKKRQAQKKAERTQKEFT